MEQHLIHVHWAKAILCNSLYGRSRRNPNSFSLDSIRHNFGIWYSLNLILNRFHVTLLASYIAVKWSPRSIYGISPRTLYSLGDIKYHKFLPIMTPESRLHYQISPCQRPDAFLHHYMTQVPYLLRLSIAVRLSCLLKPHPCATSSSPSGMPLNYCPFMSFLYSWIIHTNRNWRGKNWYLLVAIVKDLLV